MLVRLRRRREVVTAFKRVVQRAGYHGRAERTRPRRTATNANANPCLVKN